LYILVVLANHICLRKKKIIPNIHKVSAPNCDVKMAPPNAPLTPNYHLHSMYITKIIYVPMWKKLFENQTLFLHNFFIRYPNITFLWCIGISFHLLVENEVKMMSNRKHENLTSLIIVNRHSIAESGVLGGTHHSG